MGTTRWSSPLAGTASTRTNLPGATWTQRASTGSGIGGFVLGLRVRRFLTTVDVPA
jgi:hypothetical protein